MVDDQERELAQEALRFFGEVSASISHEIKNVLAVIGESSGLLEDLLTMSRTKGSPVDPQRLEVLAGKIRKQVLRADEIIQNMNRFAHSIDEPFRNLDLAQAVAVTVALFRRRAAQRGVSLEIAGTEAPVSVMTDPFLLHFLVWLCLDFAVAVAGVNKKVTLAVDGDLGRGRVVLGALQELTVWPCEAFAQEQTAGLVSALQAELRADLGGKVLEIHLPRRVNPEGGRVGRQ
jgi:signal transduction histidine kinase